MRRSRILAVLLCALGMALPLMSLPAQSEGECLAGQCSSNSDCGPDGFCRKQPGHGCGYCVYA